MAAHATALDGNLGEVSVEPLIRMISRARLTGVLEIAGPLPSLVYFSGGRLYVATSADPKALERALIGSGVVNDAGWHMAMSQTPAGEPLIPTLVHVVGADVASLQRAIFDHSAGTVFELMLPSRAQFRFREDRVHPLGDLLPFDSNTVLGEADTRRQAWLEIARDIPSTTMVPSLSLSLTDNQTKVCLSADEWHVLAQIDGNRSIAELVAELEDSAFTVCGLLHRLLRKRVIWLR